MKVPCILGFGLLMISAPAIAQEETTAELQPQKVAKPQKQKKSYPTRTVKGKITDATTGNPIGGAIISVAEIDGYSTISHDDGTYEVKVPLFATSLQFSAPDYNIAKRGLAKSEMQQTVGIYPSKYNRNYQKKTNITADESTSDFRFSNAVSIDEEIEKRLGADVHVVGRNGTPGTGSVMMIDGINSLNVNAQPLIIVDGVIFDQQYGRDMLHSGFYNNILNNIAPSDIESVTVLRNGTALYGAKGANGVILIQTRRNKSMATRITASVSAGVTLEPKYIDMMDASQYKSYASDLLSTTSTKMTDFKFLNSDPSYYYYPQYNNNTDWKKLLYRSAISQNYNINVEGGDDVASYNLSLGYTNNQSTLKYNSSNRLNIRFNADINITSAFAVRFDASFANQTRNLRNDGAPENYDEGTPTSATFLGYAKSPMLSPYAYANGVLSNSFIDTGDESYLDEALYEYSNYNYKLANPVAVNVYGDAANKNHFENSMVNLAVTPKYQFTNHLYAQEHFSYNLINSNEKYYIPVNGVPDYYVSSVNASRENEARSLFSKQNSLQSDTRIDWSNTYGAHAIHVFGGARINWETYTLNTQLGYNTGSDKTPFISSDLLNAQTTGTDDSWTNIAWYLQGEYNYLQRYYAQVNVTAETSSRFGTDADNSVKAFGAPWAVFPGIQAGWVATNEPWFPKTSAINYLRINAGFDVTGNDDIYYYAGRSYFTDKTFMQTITGLSFENIGNTNIQWETTKRCNLGFETNLLDDRINARFNYYRSTTDHLLTYQALNYKSGLEKNWTNGGQLKNNGFDVTVSGKIIATKDFQWELGASMGHYDNKITELTNGQSYIENTVYGATIRTQVGHAANEFYGYKTLGVFATSEEAQEAGLYILGDNGIDKTYFGAGDIHFADLNGDHRIDENDRTFIGNPNPDIYGNIFTSVSYRNLRLDMNFNYSLGNDVYNYMRSQLEGGSRFINQTTAMLRRWQGEGQITDIPRATFQDPMENSRFSDRWIEDGSYIRLKTVTLSYTLPISKSWIQGMQFWIQANNLFTCTKYLGSDPEFTMTSSVIGQGIDLGQLPQSRSFVAGIKINL